MPNTTTGRLYAAHEPELAGWIDAQTIFVVKKKLKNKKKLKKKIKIKKKRKN